MKNDNRAEKYFHQKSFSTTEIIFLAVAIVAGIVATFVWGGGPIGLPLMLVAIIAFVICRSLKIKDDEIERLLHKILAEHQMERTDDTLAGYDLKQAMLKKRKDGKVISPIYYLTNVVFDSSETVFHIHVVDLISATVEKKCLAVDEQKRVELAEENIKTPVGPRRMSYIKIEGCDTLIPVTLTDYQSSQLLEKICDRHTRS